MVKRRFELLESRKELISDSPHQYINILGNKLGLLVNLSTMQGTSLEEGKTQFFEIVKTMKKFSRLWRSVTGLSEIEIRVFANPFIGEVGRMRPSAEGSGRTDSDDPHFQNKLLTRNRFLEAADGIDVLVRALEPGPHGVDR